MTDSTNAITATIDIQATLDRVWELVSEPGWFVNEGSITDHSITTSDDLSRVVDPVHGEFVIQTVHLEPPRRAEFRWVRGDSDPAGSSPSTTVEFRLETVAGATRLSVTESGFDLAYPDPDARRAALQANSDGWTIELDAARAHLEIE